MTKSIIWVDTKKQMDTHTHTHTHTHKHIHTHTHVHMHTHGDRLMQLCHLVVVGVGHKQRTRRGEDTKKKTDGHARAHTRRQTDAAKPPCGCRSQPQAEDQRERGGPRPAGAAVEPLCLTHPHPRRQTGSGKQHEEEFKTNLKYLFIFCKYRKLSTVNTGNFTSATVQ